MMIDVTPRYGIETRVNSSRLFFIYSDSGLVYPLSLFIMARLTMIDIYDSKAHTWIKWVHAGLSTHCYYNEATTWIDFTPSQVPSGGIAQCALRHAFGCARFFAKFQKIRKNWGKIS